MKKTPRIHFTSAYGADKNSVHTVKWPKTPSTCHELPHELQDHCTLNTGSAKHHTFEGKDNDNQMESFLPHVRSHLKAHNAWKPVKFIIRIEGGMGLNFSRSLKSMLHPTPNDHKICIIMSL